MVKPHGLKGDMIVDLITPITERLAPGAVLLTDRGPVTVTTSKVHGTKWVVRFDVISDRNTAELWRAVELRTDDVIDEPIVDEYGDELVWVHQLLGAKVVETDGTDRGVVAEIHEAPAADLLVLDSGALVPMNFVVDGPTDGVITIDPPEGLFDL